MQDWQGCHTAVPALRRVEGSPCRAGLLDGPVCLVAAVLAEGATSLPTRALLHAGCRSIGLLQHCHLHC